MAPNETQSPFRALWSVAETSRVRALSSGFPAKEGGVGEWAALCRGGTWAHGERETLGPLEGWGVEALCCGQRGTTKWYASEGRFIYPTSHRKTVDRARL